MLVDCSLALAAPVLIASCKGRGGYGYQDHYDEQQAHELFLHLGHLQTVGWFGWIRTLVLAVTIVSQDYGDSMENLRLVFGRGGGARELAPGEHSSIATSLLATTISVRPGSMPIGVNLPCRNLPEPIPRCSLLA